jgi:hypothetical protein
VDSVGGRGSGLGLPAVARSAKAGARLARRSAKREGGGSGLGPRDLLWVLALIPFVLLATANSAGYRYGASDLAFYGPAVMRQLDPELFPRDRPVLDAQAKLTFMDETVAAIARRTTTHLPSLFLGLYIATLILLAAGVMAIGSALSLNRWTVVALLAACTVRHAITKSGTNSLEGYFHPRQLAFAFGIIAVAAFLRGRPLLAVLALAGAGSLHPTTTLWFAVWLSAAIFATARLRWPLAVVAGALALVAWWAFAVGPLAGRLTLMDPEWLEALAGKDYLFPLQWPFPAWLANLAYIPIIVFAYRRRLSAGLASRAERGMVIGCLALVAVFFAALVLQTASVALAIQLQPARIFWMLDFTATVYVVWALAEGGLFPRLQPAAVAALVAGIALVRGAYVMRVEFPSRSLFETAVRGDWGRVAAWAQSTPKDTGWIVDPMHAARYGTSLRMAFARDVFVEGTKDAAIGMYDRTIAFRTRDRQREIGDVSVLSVDGVRTLSHEYGLSYFVTEQQFPLPLAFEAGAIRVYRIP